MHSKTRNKAASALEEYGLYSSKEELYVVKFHVWVKHEEKQ